MVRNIVIHIIFSAALSFILIVSGCSSVDDWATVTIDVGLPKKAVCEDIHFIDRVLRFFSSSAFAAAPPDVNGISVRAIAGGKVLAVKNYLSYQTIVTMKVPAGDNRIFVVDAFDYFGNLIYTGMSFPVDLSPGQTTGVIVVMGPAGPGKIYVANWGSDTVSVIDGSTNSVTGTIPVGSGPGGVGANTATKKVYVSNMDSGTVSVINSNSDTVVGSIPLGFSTISFEIYDVQVNPLTNKIYVGFFYDADDVAVINGATDTMGLPIDRSSYCCYTFGIGINTTTNKIYMSQWGNAIIAEGAGDIVLGDVPNGTWDESRGVGVNPATNKVYIANFSSDYVHVVNGVTDNEITTVDIDTVGIPDGPWGVAVNSRTNRIYVAKYSTNTVAVINGADDSLITNIAVGTNPIGVAVNSVTNRIYVSNSWDNTVSVIDGNTNSVTDTIPVGVSPAYLAVMQ